MPGVYLTEFSLPLQNPVTSFTLVLVIILLVPFLLKKIKTPAIIGLILAGIIIGPHGIGLLERNSAVVLFSTIGLLYIMFLAGLELDFDQFKSSKYKSILFGVFTFSVPLAIGFPVCYYLLGYSFNTSLLTSSMFATHTLIAYPVVSRLGISKSEPVAITVGGTIFTDTLVLIILAITIGISRGTTDLDFWIKLAGAMAVFTWVTFYVIPKFSGWFFRHFESEKNSHFIYSLTVVFVLAMGAELAGLEPIIGAFMAGLALNRSVPSRSPLMIRLEFVGNALFIPFFLISIGMVINLKVLLTGPYALIVAGVLTAVALAGKWLAALFTQLALKYNKNQRNVIFGLSSSHAIATLAVISVGFEAGIISENILNGTVVLIFVTCLVASVVTENSGKKLVLDESTVLSREESDDERIMVPVSNPESLGRLIDFAILIRNPALRNEIHALSVILENENISFQKEKNKKMLDAAIEHGSGADFNVSIYTKVDVNVSGGIVRAAKETFSNILIIGASPKKDMLDKMFGNILDKILNSYSGMVFMCRLLHPVNPVGKIHLVIPQLAYREAGFRFFIEKITVLGTNLSAVLHVHCSGYNKTAILNFLENRKEKNIPVFSPLNDPDEFLKEKNETGKNDLIIFLSARRGTVSYLSGFDLLPSTLNSKYPGMNFIVAYPKVSETEHDVVQINR